jgi:hypothetical protein
MYFDSSIHGVVALCKEEDMPKTKLLFLENLTCEKLLQS